MKKKILSILMITMITVFTFMSYVNADTSVQRTGKRVIFTQNGSQSEEVPSSTNMETYIGEKKTNFENVLSANGLSEPNGNIDYNSLFDITEGNYKYAAILNVGQPSYVMIDGTLTQQYEVTYVPVTVTKSDQIATITFQPNGGNGNMQEQYVRIGDQYSLPENHYNPPAGKEFDKWEVENQGYKNPGEQINITGNVLIRPTWKQSQNQVERINTIDINIVKPKIGDKVSLRHIVDDEYGFEYDMPDKFPLITTNGNANYDIDYTAYIVSLPSIDPEGYDGQFAGTFEGGRDYYVEVSLFAKENFVFAGNNNMTIKVNGQTTNIEKGEYNGEDGTYYLFYVKIQATNEDVPRQKYTLTSGNITLSFENEIGHNYMMEAMDVMNMTKEERETNHISEEEYNEAFNLITNNLKQYGTLLNVYVIEVFDSNSNYEGEAEIRIKLTDEMKKFNSFKFIYLDENNQFKVGEIVDLKIEGDYLVGKLPHLSVYAIVGNNVENGPNPKTGDNIYMYITIAAVGIVGLIGAGIFVVKKNK